MFKSFFKNKKVLLTGHTGFKGSWMAFVLHQLGAHVYGYSLDNEYPNSIFEELELHKICKHKIGDIRHYEELKKYVWEVQPDVIFHLAAQSLVRKSYLKPLLTFEVNIQGTANVLECLKVINGKCMVICITSDKVYENPEHNIPFVENDKLGGYDPYSSSKAAAELVIASYRNSFYHPDKFEQHQKSIASVRAGNVIGGGDRCADRLIPDLIKSIEQNETLTLRNPQAVRPWQHVLEPAVGYLILAEKMYHNPQKFAQAFNFGPNESDAITVEEIVKMGIEKIGRGNYKIENNTDKPHEANYLRLNTDKVKHALGWKPVYSISEAVQKTMEWYASSDKREITHSQVAEYLEKLSQKLYLQND